MENGYLILTDCYNVENTSLDVLKLKDEVFEYIGKPNSKETYDEMLEIISKHFENNFKWVLKTKVKSNVNI